MYCFTHLFLLKKSSVDFYNNLLAEGYFEAFCRRNRYIIRRKTFFSRELLILLKASRLQFLAHLLEEKARENPAFFSRIKSASGFAWLRKLYFLICRLR